MKKLAFLFLLALCLMTSACTGAQRAVETQTPQQTVLPANTSTPTVSTEPDPTESRPGYYYNEQYGFSLSYPMEWEPGEESAAKDGVVLYEKDGTDIRVYGGYTMEESAAPVIEDAKKKGETVSKLSTDYGETGVLIEGVQEGKTLFRFRIAGKEKYVELYALTSDAFYTQNKELLLKTARQLLLDEEARKR